MLEVSPHRFGALVGEVPHRAPRPPFHPLVAPGGCLADRKQCINGNCAKIYQCFGRLLLTTRPGHDKPSLLFSVGGSNSTR